MHAEVKDKPSATVWSREYWASKGKVRLYVYRKRAAPPQRGDKPLPVLFLVHGSSMSGRSGYDLQVPGRTDYSLMDHFSGLGYDVWTLDHPESVARLMLSALVYTGEGSPTLAKRREKLEEYRALAS